MTLEEVEMLLASCQNGNRLSQKRLYQQFYGFGMSVCIRYAKDRQEAEEVCHDGFVKIFTRIGDCKSVGSFKAWMRQIFIRSAIDYYRKYRKTQPCLEPIDRVAEQGIDDSALDQLSVDEKLKMVQNLPPAYRLAFNLYAVEGYSTAEIADSLQISEGTVRANVAKARLRLQAMIIASNTQKVIL